MSAKIKSLNNHELCNDPSKICTSFAIDLDDINAKNIWDSTVIWVENDPSVTSLNIVAAPHSIDNDSSEKLLRYYILDNPCVQNRNPKFEDSAYVM